MSPVKQTNEFERRQEDDEVGSEECLGGFSSLLLDQRPTDQGLCYRTWKFCTHLCQRQGATKHNGRSLYWASSIFITGKNEICFLWNLGVAPSWQCHTLVLLDPNSWDQDLSADVKFLSVLWMALSEYWKQLEKIFRFLGNENESSSSTARLSDLLVNPSLNKSKRVFSSGGARTHTTRELVIISQMLYQLSYQGLMLGEAITLMYILIPIFLIIFHHYLIFLETRPSWRGQ